MENSFEGFVKRVVSALNKSMVNYVIIGGITAIIYGRPRTTMNIDVIIDLKASEKEKIENLVAIFSKFNLDVTAEEIVDALIEGSHFSVFDKLSPFRIDAKGINTKLDQIAIKNRRKITLFGLKTWIEAPEDLIVAKLIYGSPQDIEDALSVIINMKDELDIDYLTKRAQEENVYNMLTKIFRKTKEI